MQSLLSQLHKDSTEVEVQQCLTYLHDTYPNCTHQLYSNATVMYRDSSHRNNWRASPECSDLHHGAIFSEWLHMRLPPTTIRLGLFMSLQSTWVGAQNPQHQYPQHVWVAAIRPASGNIRGKELLIWDNEWQRIRANLVANNKRLDVGHVLLGGQKALYNFLKSKTQGRMNIHKIWIAGDGVHNCCLSESMAWIEGVLQIGGLDGDLVSLGFHNLLK